MSSAQDLRERIEALGPWFHNLRIGGVQTAPDHPLGDYPHFKWERFRHVVPEDLQGASVLDIGCNGGFYAIEMARRGAGEVVAIDSDSRYLDQARLAAAASGGAAERISFRQINVYEIGTLARRFDLVLFMGVFYHLRHPLLALDLLHEHVVGDRLLFQSMQCGASTATATEENYAFFERQALDRYDWPRLHFIERSFAEDPTNWFIPNAGAVEGMLRSSGFVIQEHPEREVYLCTRGTRPEFTPAPPAVGRSGNGADPD
jgi:tRNA (mo5U34)-methyltransferase